MTLKKFGGPWGEAASLGCRNLFCGDRLMLDLFDFGQAGPAEEVNVGDEGPQESYIIGLTESSRIWRITFDRPYALRMRDHNIRRAEPKTLDLPGPCSFSEDSDWIREFVFDPRLGEFIPTHYIFALLDDVVEVLANDQPFVEELPNDFGKEES